jgi:hypothetical protein
MVGWRRPLAIQPGVRPATRGASFVACRLVNRALQLTWHSAPQSSVPGSAAGRRSTTLDDISPHAAARSGGGRPGSVALAERWRPQRSLRIGGIYL